MFRHSDVLSVHCPLTLETKGLVNAARLATMKPTAYLLNTSRGPVINEADLADALNAGTICGAGLDVLSTEPPGGGQPALDREELPHHPAHRVGVEGGAHTAAGRGGGEHQGVSGGQAAERGVLRKDPRSKNQGSRQTQEPRFKVQEGIGELSGGNCRKRSEYVAAVAGVAGVAKLPV